nr:MAG: hypothetical protein 2 [Yunnan alphaflexivirus]
MTFVTLDTFVSYHRMVMERLNDIYQLTSSRAHAASVDDLRHEVSAWHRQPAAQLSPPEPRTFFADLGLLQEATAQILSNIPPARYDINMGVIPTTELLGQLHALHANTLEWLRHINGLLTGLDQHLRAQIPDPQAHTRNEGLQQAIQALAEQLTRIAGANADTSRSILSQLAELHNGGHDGNASVVNLLSRILASLPNPTVPETAASLPSYVAVHPNEHCRTFGYVFSQQAAFRLPMDFTSRPLSTAYQLFFEVHSKPGHSELVAALYDAGALVLQRTLTTPHKLDSMPGDALALLHSDSPHFIYKLRGRNT